MKNKSRRTSRRIRTGDVLPGCRVTEHAGGQHVAANRSSEVLLLLLLRTISAIWVEPLGLGLLLELLLLLEL